MEACIETIAKNAVGAEEKKCCNGNKCSNCTCGNAKGESKKVDGQNG